MKRMLVVGLLLLSFASVAVADGPGQIPTKPPVAVADGSGQIPVKPPQGAVVA